MTVDLTDYPTYHLKLKKISYGVQVNELWTVVCRRLSEMLQKNINH